uniref:Putative secreted protein n=1 Tax=Anopheles darlingi TaxID=43151 RepID=A0A2M4D360_ANODA
MYFISTFLLLLLLLWFAIACRHCSIIGALGAPIDNCLNSTSSTEFDEIIQPARAGTVWAGRYTVFALYPCQPLADTGVTE